MTDIEETGRYPKRERKPKVAFIPDHPGNNKKKRVNVPKKHRNLAADTKQANKWKDYKELIKKTVNYLIRDTQALEVRFEGKTAPPRGKNSLWEMERMKLEKKILTAKQVIVTTLQAIDSENAEDKRWPELLADKNEVDGEEDDGMLDVDGILCSRCNEEETEDNDILFCDKAGCGRAYHQKCLEPALDMTYFDPEEDWFCWQCECMDDCLEIISERLDGDYWDWKEIFPEVNQSLQSLSNGDTILTADFGDDDEEDEEEYAPSDDEEEEDYSDGEDSEEERTGGISNLHERHELTDILEEENNPAIGNDEEDSEEDSDDEESEEEDDEEIDPDEVQGLLEDANISYIPDLSNLKEEAPISRRLRERRTKKEAIVVELKGQEDVGRLAARVRRGVFQLGKVVEFIPTFSHEVEKDIDLTASHWKVVFSKRFLRGDSEEGSISTDPPVVQTENNLVNGSVGDTVESEPEENHTEKSDEEVRNSKRRGDIEEVIVLSATQITEAFTMYEEYLQRLQGLQQNHQHSSQQQAISELLQTSGKIDIANVIDHKRERKVIDYVSLSLQLFGSLRDEDEEDEEVEDGGDKMIEETSTKGRRRRKRKTFHDDLMSRESSDVEEIDEKLDEEWDDSNSNQRKKSRKRKHNH